MGRWYGSCVFETTLTQLHNTHTTPQLNNNNNTILNASHQQSNTGTDDDFYDRSFVSILTYAVLASDVRSTKQICDRIDEMYPLKHDEMRMKLLVSLTPTAGYVSKQIEMLGIPSGQTTLNLAMFFSNVEVVTILLDKGVSPYLVSAGQGLDAVMCGAITGNIENLRYFLTRYPDWDMSRRLKITGSSVLHVTVLLGANKLEVVKLLVEKGASPDMLSYSGSSVLINAVENVDSDPHVVEFLLECASSDRGVNYR